MPGRIITISQQKGGSGKTTLAANLAIALSSPGSSVAVLDADPHGSLGHWFEARQRRMGVGRTGIEFRAASGWGSRREARSLARDHDIVIIDTPPRSDLESKPAIEAADLVAVPIQPTPVDLWATEATLRALSREGSRALLIINRMPARGTLSAELSEAIAQLGFPVADTRLGNRVAFASGMGVGSTILESAPGSKGAAEMQALAQEILAQLPK